MTPERVLAGHGETWVAMPVLWIPPDPRDLTNDQGEVRVQGKTVGQALANLEIILRFLAFARNDLFAYYDTASEAGIQKLFLA